MLANQERVKGETKIYHLGGGQWRYQCSVCKKVSFTTGDYDMITNINPVVCSNVNCRAELVVSETIQ